MSQGKTVEAALKNVKEAISVYIEALPPKKRRVTRPTMTTTVEV
jgi:predicted RNase H-like HicB family nuclease